MCVIDYTEKCEGNLKGMFTACTMQEKALAGDARVTNVMYLHSQRYFSFVTRISRNNGIISAINVPL